jgi:hypothetical protein
MSKEKETLEEASERILANNVDGLKDALQDDDLFYFYKDVIKFYGQEMAKWQQEQSVDLSNVNANNITTTSTENKTLWKEMYSEEDVTEYAIYIVFNNLITPKQWLEQFKNKQNCLQIK